MYQLIRGIVTSTVVVVLILMGTTRDSDAQTRMRGGGQQQPVATQPPPPAPQSPAPTTGSRFTSTLKFVPPPRGVRPSPFPPGGFIRPGFVPGRFAFWPWGAWLPVPLYTSSGYYETSSGDYEVPLENAPVGGVQLDIDPRRAQVYVDGTYVGVVEEFSGYFHHLEVPAGPHDIAVVAPGYDTLSVHVVVTPGATLTQRASLSRAYGR
jgi:hypothetical protein